MTKRIALRGLVALPLVVLMVGAQKLGVWMDVASGRRFDALMDWIYGGQSWR